MERGGRAKDRLEDTAHILLTTSKSVEYCKYVCINVVAPGDSQRWIISINGKKKKAFTCTMWHRSLCRRMILGEGDRLKDSIQIHRSSSHRRLGLHDPKRMHNLHMCSYDEDELLRMMMIVTSLTCCYYHSTHMSAAA